MSLRLWEAFKAASEGKEVEWRNSDNTWKLMYEEAWTIDEARDTDLEFRLKPEPVKPFETWAVVWPDGMSETYTREDWAKKLAKECQGRAVLLREVTGE